MTDFDFEHDPKTLRTAIERAAASELELTFRSMFGGIMGYVAGRPFASLSNRGLALKLDATSQETLLAEKGARRLRYEPTDPPSKTYVLVPDAILSKPRTLRVWLDRSAAYVATIGARKTTRARARR